jgi:rhamnulokinase
MKKASATSRRPTRRAPSKVPVGIHLAIDLGAGSGRVIAGSWDGHTVAMKELHRFANVPVIVADTMRWNVMQLWADIEHGLSLAAKKHGGQTLSLGVDTWGVDYALLSESNELLGQPFNYRDSRTDGVAEKAFQTFSREKIFQGSGLQFMPFNTLFQLLAAQKSNPEILREADCLLMIPDFLHWCLCGSRVVEVTNASTTQFLNPHTGRWNLSILKRLGIPTHFLPKLVQPGKRLGLLRPSVQKRTGLPEIQVVAPPTHDTASAVAAVPTTQTGKANWAYLSSGTWSLLGVELKKPVLTPRALELNMTNEVGIDGTFRLLKNIMGLWLVQRCKVAFDAKGKNFDYTQLAGMASAAEPFRSFLDLRDSRFLNPPDMPVAMQEFCRETKQPIPKTIGHFIRCAYESLALAYGKTLAELEELTGERIEVLHIVGGGSSNVVLNRFAAEACQIPVVAGPSEATALGNILTQVRAFGGLTSLSDMRMAVRNSTGVKIFKPENKAKWQEASERFQAMAR